MLKLSKILLLFTIVFAMVESYAGNAKNYTMEFCGKRTRLFVNGREVTFADCLKEQLKSKEKQQFQDLVKQAYQGAYGAGHAILNRQKAWAYFSREFAAVEAADEELFEIISPDYCRINLKAWKKSGMPKEWLFNMFYASAEIFPDSGEVFQKYLAGIRQICPETADEMEKFRRKHRGEAVHHSPLYGKIYRPSYRIVSTRFITMLPVLKAAAKLPLKQVRIIAIDGRAASGKTTLSRQLAAVLEAQVIHMDDFFLPVNLRTPDRLAEAGGNVHYERFKQEVLPNLRNSAGFTYRKFDCSKMALGADRVIAPGKWRIVEGAYSLHPEFGNYADLKLFFDIDPAEQMKRIRQRNGEKQAAIFAARWIPLEENYINGTGVIRKVDLILGRTDSSKN